MSRRLSYIFRKARISAAGALFFTVFASNNSAHATENANCWQLDHGDARFTVCAVDPAHDDIRIFNKDPAGEPYRTFNALVDQLWRGREVLSFAVNGGMYNEDLGPVGLYVEYGIERKAANHKDGYGNFHLKPNGVFAIAKNKAVVMETEAYGKSGFKADYATQSGPMLVIDGKIHPAFKPDSDSLKVRNGVGVDDKGVVFLVLSERPIRFYDFARHFRDELKCDNALFLDGTISSIYAPSLKRNGSWYPLGPIIGVVKHLPD